MRLFIAIQLNDEMKNALVRIQNAMKRQGVRGNFTRRENLHLTLAFIGEYSDTDEVLEIMDQVQFEPFDLRLDGVAKMLRHGLADAGISFDHKKFSPHITLVRKAHSLDGRIPAGVLEGAGEAGMLVDHISLMRSDRGKNGMVYTEIF